MLPDTRSRLLVLVASLLAMTQNAMAAGEDWLNRPQVVVELYTSQGCNSCPPADRLIARMVGCGQILPLGFHVDYWDYLGWEDTFASPSHTSRQKSYARAFNETTIYTPQIVIQGVERMVGSYVSEVEQAIGNAARHLPEYQIRLDLETMQISGDGTRDNLALTLVTFDPTLHHVAIERGENRDRTIPYANVVTDLHSFNLDRVTKSTIPVPDEVPELLARTDDSVSILIHDRDSMRILTAWARHSDSAADQPCTNNMGIF